MSYLKFYKDERERWPQLCWGRAVARMGAAEAELGIRRIAAHFGLSLRGTHNNKGFRLGEPVSIRFTSGNRRSRAGFYRIIINLDWADWLVIAHEVAHTYYVRRLAFETRSGRNAHGRRTAGIIDRFAAWIVEQGWHLGTLAHEVAAEEESRAARHAVREREAAMPEPIDARISRRRAQVKRLEAKLKGTTTRLKKARRSLAALERSAARKKENG